MHALQHNIAARSSSTFRAYHRILACYRILVHCAAQRWACILINFDHHQRLDKCICANNLIHSSSACCACNLLTTHPIRIFSHHRQLCHNFSPYSHIIASSLTPGKWVYLWISCFIQVCNVLHTTYVRQGLVNVVCIRILSQHKSIRHAMTCVHIFNVWSSLTPDKCMRAFFNVWSALTPDKSIHVWILCFL